MPIAIAKRLAGYGAALKYAGLGPETVHEVKRRVIDSLGCMIGASSSPPVIAAVQLAPDVKAGASILGIKKTTTPDTAAFVNGVMVRYLDFNDTYLSKEPAHPSDNIPAALACAQASGRGAKDFIAAVAAAYEIQCRLCDAASLRSRGWDHVTYGAFSSTVCAAMLLGLTKDETINALGIIGAASPALRQTRAGALSMWKGCAFADIAKRSVFAAQLAQRGVTGPTDIFEGQFGFMKLVSGPIELGAFGGEGGGRFRILDTCIKYYPVEYHAQSAVAAAIEVRKGIKSLTGIDSVRVSTFRAAYEIIGSGPEKKRPSTRETADHSLAYCVAAALIDGAITHESFSDKRRMDEKLLALAGRVEVTVDMGLDRLYPEAMPNSVVVRLKGGKSVSDKVVYPKGHPRNPLTDKEVEDKFSSLVSGRYSGKQTKRMLNALWGLEGIKDMSDVFKLFADGKP